MKFNKTSIQHYFVFSTYLILFISAYIITLFINKKNNKIFLMGHRLEGNLESFIEQNKNIYNLNYLTFDNKIAKSHSYSYTYLNLKNIINLLNSNLIIATHGILFHKLIKIRGIKTINIGHGVQTEILNYSSRERALFDEVWLSCELDYKILKEDCGYRSSNLVVTGFIKHQQILKQESEKGLYQKFKKNNKFWIYAPTLSPDGRNLDNNLFSLKNHKFLEKLNELSLENDCITIIKPHHNEYLTKKNGVGIEQLISNYPKLQSFENFNKDSAKFFPNMVDLLITDWSSIFLDYLVTNKPIIFLNSHRNEKYPVSRYFQNQHIYRVDSYRSLADQINQIDPVKNAKLKKYIFKNLEVENINSTYTKRLRNLID